VRSLRRFPGYSPAAIRSVQSANILSARVRLNWFTNPVISGPRLPVLRAITPRLHARLECPEALGDLARSFRAQRMALHALFRSTDELLLVLDLRKDPVPCGPVRESQSRAAPAAGPARMKADNIQPPLCPSGAIVAVRLSCWPGDAFTASNPRVRILAPTRRSSPAKGPAARNGHDRRSPRS